MYRAVVIIGRKNATEQVTFGDAREKNGFGVNFGAILV